MNSNNKTTIKISGMSCSGCANMIEENLSQLNGVQRVSVDLKESTATVKYESDSVSLADFKKTVEATGYNYEGTK